MCLPYSIKNLHLMASALNIKRCWFHRDHYDIPKRRTEEIMTYCVVVSSKDIVSIIKGETLEGKPDGDLGPPAKRVVP